jgi:Tfp pilus assembly protein FimV
MPALGRLSVHSYLGQFLHAEIQLLGGVDRSTVAELASPDEYRRFGLEFSQALSSLKFTNEGTPDRVVVTSTAPIKNRI